MSLELKDGTIKIGGIYNLKVDVTQYQNQSLSQSISVEYAVPDGMETAAAIAQAQAQYDALVNVMKTAVMTHLGVEGQLDANGVLQPVLEERVENVAPIQSAPSYQQPAAPQQSDGSGGQFRPKVDKATLEQLPKFQADLDGQGVTVWYDLRPIKAAPGTQPGPNQFAATAADFRDVTNNKHQVWMRHKSGDLKPDVAAALQAAGVPV